MTLVGSELIRVSLHTSKVILHFQENDVCFYQGFRVETNANMWHIDICKREGDLSALWELIGSKIEALSQTDNVFCLTFSDGRKIVTERSPDRLAGEVVSADYTFVDQF